GPAAGGDRRAHAGQCRTGHRRRRRPAGGDRRGLRRSRSRRRRPRLHAPVRNDFPREHPSMNTERSHALFTRAQALMPGGVNSPVRAFRSVGGEPFFAARAEGAYIEDVDGNRYVDYVGSWGPMIAGHAHPAVLEAVAKVMRDGLSFGVPNALEVEMAEEVRRLVPS